MTAPGTGLSHAFALLLAVLVAFAGIGSHSLWSPDEPTGAAVGRAMLDRGDLVVPRLNGEPFLEKPPLYWWVQVAAFRWLGVSDEAARVPSALFSALTLLVAYVLGRRLGGARQGLLALVVLATTLLFVQNSGRVIVDPALMFFTALAHLGFAMLIAPRSAWEARWARLLIAVALPLGFLSKGVVALGLGAGPPVLFLLAARRGRAWRDLALLAATCLPLLALIVAPWVWALYRTAGWPAVQECLINNTVGRLVPQAEAVRFGHRQPWGYYLGVGPLVLLPWILALPAMLRAGVFRSGGPGSEPRRLLLATAGLGVLMLSAAATKRELYLMPLLPAWSACVAWWLAGIGEGGAGRSWDRRALLILLGFAAGLTLLLSAAALGIAWAPRLPDSLALARTSLSGGQVEMFGLAALLAGAALLVLLIRRWQAPPVAAIAAAYLLFFLAAETELQALIDPLKRMDELTVAISRQCPGTGPVPAYLPPLASNESLFGIIGFKLGRQTLPLTTAEAVRSYFESHPGAAVLLRSEQARRLPPAVLGRMRFVYDETGRKALPWAIAVWSQPPREAKLSGIAGHP